MLLSFFEKVNAQDVQRQNLFQVYFSKIPDSIQNQAELENLYSKLNAQQQQTTYDSSNSMFDNYISSGMLSDLYDYQKSAGLFFNYDTPKFDSIDTVFGVTEGTKASETLEQATFFQPDGINISVKGVQLPDTEITYEMDTTKRLRSMRPTGRNEQKLIITFYNFGSNQDYIFFKNWIELVLTPNNYYNFLDDVSTDILVYANNRQGIPVAIHSLTKCVPTRLQALTFNNDTPDVQTFEIEFFVGEYRQTLVNITEEQFNNMRTNGV